MPCYVVATAKLTNILTIKEPANIVNKPDVLTFDLVLQAFHVSGKQHNNPGFLSKSYLFFLLFNILLYMLLFAEFVTMETSSLDYNLLRNIFNGCYAGLMTIEVFFFLVYGVEVFFKVVDLNLFHDPYYFIEKQKVCFFKESMYNLY